MKKIEGYENDLGEYGPQLFDSYCGEPIEWGFKILRRLDEERFNNLRKFGDISYGHSSNIPTPFLIVKRLTKEEAIEKYGPITKQEFGPRGGFRTITFGDKTFMQRYLAK